MADRDAIRARILEEHRALHSELEGLAALAEEYPREDRRLLGPLESRLEALIEQLERHMAWETTLAGDTRRPLSPLHDAQLDQLGSLLEELRCADRPVPILAAHVAEHAERLQQAFRNGEPELGAT